MNPKHHYEPRRKESKIFEKRNPSDPSTIIYKSDNHFLPKRELTLDEPHTSL